MVDFGGILGNFMAPLAKTGWALAYLFLVLCIVGGIGALFWYVILPNVRLTQKVIIHSIRGKGIGKTIITKGGFVKRGQNEVFVIRKRRTQPAPPLNYFQPDGTIHYIEPALNTLKPINLNVGNPADELKADVIPEDVKFWQALETERAAERWKKDTFWSKYGPMVEMGMMMAFFLVVVIITVKYLGGAISEASSILKAAHAGGAAATPPPPPTPSGAPY